MRSRTQLIYAAHFPMCDEPAATPGAKDAMTGGGQKGSRPSLAILVSNATVRHRPDVNLR
jgi:hypothetical protein